MDINYNSCRLCKSIKSTEILDLCNSSSLIVKINYCLGIQISLENLPSYVCKRCKKKINKFFDFKIKCLDVDEELKNISYIRDETSQEETLAANNNSTSEDNKPDYLNEKDSEEFLVNETNSTKCIKNLITQNPQIQCEQCGEICETKIAFKKHGYIYHTQPKRFHCKYCPKTFTTSENCNTHMRSHSGTKPYVCEICGSTSTKLSDLVRHMKVHNDEKNHNCQICGRAFKRSHDLVVHIRTHSGDRPFKCRFCEKDYRSHGGLRKHMLSHNT